MKITDFGKPGWPVYFLLFLVEIFFFIVFNGFLLIARTFLVGLTLLREVIDVFLTCFTRSLFLMAR